MAQGESALLTIVEYQTLVLLVETDHLDLIGRMYHCQLTILASLVYNTIGERNGWLITNGDFCNFLIHHFFTVYTKQDSKHLACCYTHAVFPFQLVFLMVKRFDNVFHLILDQEAIKETVGEGDGQNTTLSFL